jgi:hypothetical protein
LGEIIVLDVTLKIMMVFAGVIAFGIGLVIMVHQLGLFGLEPLTVQNSGMLIVLLLLFGGACLKNALTD